MKQSIKLEDIRKAQPPIGKQKSKKSEWPLDKALGLGAEAEVLEEILTRIPYLNDRLDPLVPDLRFETLQKLPDMLRVFAERLKKVNSSKFINPRAVLVRWVEPNCLSPDQVPEPIRTWVRTRTNEQKAQAFEILPHLLKDYSDYLKFAIRHPGRGRYSEQQIYKARLLVHLKERTDKPRFELATQLLWAAFTAAGRNFEDTSHSLRDLWKSHPDLRFLIYLYNSLPK